VKNRLSPVEVHIASGLIAATFLRLRMGRRMCACRCWKSGHEVQGDCGGTDEGSVDAPDVLDIGNTSARNRQEIQRRAESAVYARPDARWKHARTWRTTENSLPTERYFTIFRHGRARPAPDHPRRFLSLGNEGRYLFPLPPQTYTRATIRPRVRRSSSGKRPDVEVIETDRNSSTEACYRQLSDVARSNT